MLLGKLNDILVKTLMGKMKEKTGSIADISYYTDIGFTASYWPTVQQTVFRMLQIFPNIGIIVHL